MKNNRNPSQFDGSCFAVYILVNNNKQNNIRQLVLEDGLPENNGYVNRMIKVSESKLEVFRNKQKESQINVKDILRVEQNAFCRSVYAYQGDRLENYLSKVGVEHNLQRMFISRNVHKEFLWFQVQLVIKSRNSIFIAVKGCSNYTRLLETIYLLFN